MTQLNDPPENPGRSPQDPSSDPENKLGRPPPADQLAEDAARQRDGSAARSWASNANTPRPSEPSKDTPRDPDVEQATP